MWYIRKKRLIISLIKDDMINSKLVNGLIDAGLYAETYFLHLSETIFELLGFPDDDLGEQAYEYYLEQIKRAQSIDLRKSNEPLNAVAEDIYEGLVRRLKKRA
jgi:hypothetical protein